MIGSMIGRYRVLDKLGEGGMGVVYRARDPLLRRVVALKVLRAVPEGQALRSRILAEARAASALSHSGIGTIFEIGDPDGEPFIVMEYIEGRPLDAVIDRGLPPRTVVDHGRQLADALAHAHERGILHRA